MKHWLAVWLWILPALVAASPAGLRTLTTSDPPEQVYDRIYQALEGAKFWIVFEADMGSRLANLAPESGAEYNQSRLGFVKSMVFCNLVWTNRLANADPELLGLCPLHLSIYAKGDKTTVTWPKLSALAEGSPGLEQARALDQEVAEIIRRAVTRD